MLQTKKWYASSTNYQLIYVTSIIDGFVYFVYDAADDDNGKYWEGSEEITEFSKNYFPIQSECKINIKQLKVVQSYCVAIMVGTIKTITVNAIDIGFDLRLSKEEFKGRFGFTPETNKSYFFVGEFVQIGNSYL